MHFDFKGIMEGAFNSIFVRAKIEEIANERGAICNECPNNSVNKKKIDPKFNPINPLPHCILCGCNLHMKTRSMSQVCPDFKLNDKGEQIPAPRWLAVMDEKEEDILDTKIREEAIDLLKIKQSRNGR